MGLALASSVSGYLTTTSNLVIDLNRSIFFTQVATAVKQSHAMKNPEIPLACKPDQLYWFDRLKNYFSKKDHCEEYYKMMLTDSAYEISPLLAFYDLLATTGFHPAGYIGEKIGTFFDSLLGNTDINI